MNYEEFYNALILECVEIFFKMFTKQSIDFTILTPVKNVAYFLGYITLFNNKPLLQHDLDLKQLLYEGFLKLPA